MDCLRKLVDLVRRGIISWRTVLVVSWLGFATGAFAHDMWIVPPGALTELAPGQLIKVEMRVGHNGHHEPVHRDSRRLARLDAVHLGHPAGGAETPLPGMDGTGPAGVFRPPAAGLWAVVYESRAAYSELDAGRFARYLAEEGLDSVADLRRQRGEESEPGRELYSRSLKSLVQVGDAGGVDRPIGLPLELIAETTPRLWGHQTMIFRLLWQGEPLSDALVQVSSLNDGDGTLSARSDRNGRVRFDLVPGSWIAAVVHMEREDTSPRAEWRSVFSTLTWLIPDP